MRRERFDFEGHGGHRLAARLDLPDDAPRAAALFAHCFTCGKDIAAARRIAEGLAAHGIATLRFDFTGLGHSEGEFANAGFDADRRDLIAASRAMAERGLAPSILIGHSLGGAAVLAAVPEIEGVRAVVTIGAPAEPAHVLGRIGGDLDRSRADGSGEVSIGGRRFTLGRDFLDDTEGARIDAAVAGLRAALLVVHAPRDETVGIDNASRIFAAAKHPKSFLSLDDADHLLSRAEDAAYVAGVVAAWAARYVASPPVPEAPPEEPPLASGATRSREAAPAGFLQRVTAAGHALLADEPASVGGTDRGPGPYDLLAAALASCTAMTIRMYARRKGIALDHVAVDVEHAREHRADCEDCDERDRRVDVFRRRVWLAGDLDEAARARLMAIADRCPVHRTLEAEARIETEAMAPGR
ncbi:MAG: alpha/beta fold hydrolase [Paracoccaceae bacterium]